MYKIQVLLAVIQFLLTLANGQSASANARTDVNVQQGCSKQWQDHDSCLKRRQSEYRRSQDLTSQERASMKAKIRVCFQDQKCPDPFLTEAELSAKRKCYVQYRDRMRDDLSICIKKSYPDYSIPSENDVANDYGQDMVSMRASSCRPVDKKKFGKCVVNARAQASSSRNSGGQKRDYCEVRYECYQESQYKQRCYERSARVREELCKCNKNLPVETYKSQYRQCLKDANYPPRNESQDYNLIVLSRLGRGSKFCSNVTDPCGGFQGRQTIKRSGGGARNGGSSSGNNGFSSSSSSSSSTSADAGEDYGTSTSADADFGSLLSSGGLMQDPSEILASMGSGNLGSSLGTGFDMSQFLGNGMDMSSLTSAFTGGSDAGGFLNSLTGGGFDIGSLLNGGFGKRK